MDAAVLMGVAGVAVTQPVLDLFGRNPTFFVAGGYGRRQIVAFAVVVGFVPTLVAFMVSAVPGLVHRRLGTCLHGAAVAGFAGLFWLVVCRTVGVDALAPAVVLAIVVGVGVALAEWRVRSARLFLSYLAIGNVAFVVLFLLTSPSAKLLRGSLVCGCWKRAGPTVGWPGRRGGSGRVSVDVVATGGRLDKRVRYPRFAALAQESTWFRNAASESEYTSVSVPTILTGVVGDEDDVPFLRDHPRNLFTLFGPGHPVNAYGC